MKKRESSMFSAAAATALAACVAFVLDGRGGEIEVSPNGTSPKEALLAIRAAKAKGDKGAWTVRVKDGFYVLKETIVLTPEDSGTPEAPVLWVGEGGKAVFAGGDRLTGWKDVGGGIWSAPIPRAPDGKPAYFEQLWVNGRRADRARLPNSRQDEPRAGCLDITAASISPVTNAAGEVSYVERVTLADVSALAAVPAEELQWAQMCVVHKWAFSRRIVRSVDAAARTVETHSCMDWRSWKKWGPGKTLVWFENVRSAFDAPGEWFYDARGGAVLYRPLPGEDMAKAEVLAPSSEISRLVELRGDPDGGAYVHDVAFRGISFACTSAPTQDATRGPTQSYQLQAASGSDGAVTASGVRRISFDGCTFEHTGNYAMRFDDGCTSNSVTGCTMRDLGAGGVWMGARANHVAAGEQLSRRVIKNLAPRSTAFNRVENCLIREGGRFNPEGTGVAFTHISDSKVLHCEICDFFYTGVSVGWTWGFTGSVAQRNEIAFNRIYDLGKGVMSDMGGVYTLGTSFGTRVHHNVVHDVWACAYGGWALYTDEGSEGITMDHNLCWNTTDGGFHQHYGSGCVIRNNIFAWNRKLGAVRMNRKVVQEIPCSLHFVNNIVVVREGPLVGAGPRGVEGVWAGNLWYDYSGEKPNLDGLDWEGWRACGKEIGGAYADPQFVDAAANDFRLKPGSPAFALGFEMWDWSNAGRVLEEGQGRFVGEDPAKYWRLEELSAAPAYAELDDPVTAQPGLKSLMVSGKGPNGSKAEFFCYYGRPEGPVPKGGFPGVVMVHGGGGTAYPNYTKDWIGLGFAVISIDWYNQRPAPGLTNAPSSEISVPRIALEGGRRQDHVANVANMVLAHSLLRSFPEVNRDRTVFVGLSWGSWYGVCVSAVDDRFKGCVEIYCGDWNTGRKKFFQLVNGRFLPYAKVPMWWAVSTNDQNVTPRTSQDGFDACADVAGAAIVNRLPHSHIGFDFPSVRRMAKCFTGGAKPLPRLTRGRIEGGVVSAEILDPGAGVASAKLGYTTSTNLPTWKREWKYAPAKVEGRRVSAALPPDTVQCYLSAYEAEKSRFDDLCGSTGFLDVQ